MPIATMSYFVASDIRPSFAKPLTGIKRRLKTMTRWMIQINHVGKHNPVWARTNQVQTTKRPKNTAE
jgi:hypothetical protein